MKAHPVFHKNNPGTKQPFLSLTLSANIEMSWNAWLAAVCCRTIVGGEDYSLFSVLNSVFLLLVLLGQLFK